MTFTLIHCRDGRPIKALVEHDEPSPVSRLALVQLLSGAELIVSGKQSNFDVVIDWLVRARKALEQEGIK
jgi:hypothetical protein